MNKEGGSKKLLFFRCECYLEDKMHIQNEFSPDDYHFTHLYLDQSAIQISSVDGELEKALYLLKYALNLTLGQMLNDPQQSIPYIDEIAMISLSKQIERYLAEGQQEEMDDEIGFAVSVSFTPNEAAGKKAASILWEIDKYSQLDLIKNDIH